MCSGDTQKVLPPQLLPGEILRRGPVGLPPPISSWIGSVSDCKGEHRYEQGWKRECVRYEQPRGLFQRTACFEVVGLVHIAGVSKGRNKD